MTSDTGSNVRESTDTLLAQQARLLCGMRDVQMFPLGTPELPLPDGFARVANHRGVFHYNPSRITAKDILGISGLERENELLELGPYSKKDIIARLSKGEKLVCITEYTLDGIEVRSAAGTNETLGEQLTYFENTKQKGNVIYSGGLPYRVKEKLNGNCI